MTTRWRPDRRKRSTVNAPMPARAALLLACICLLPAAAGAQQLTLLSVPEDPLVLGVLGNAPSQNCRLGGSRYLVFSSAASNLVAGDDNASEDVFVRDRLTGELERVSVDSQGLEASGDSTMPDVSDDGRYVVFSSTAPLAQGVASTAPSQVYLHDRATASTILLSRTATAAGDADSSLPRISADGTHVVFRSNASNLVSNDSNNCADIFVHEAGVTALKRVSTSAADEQANGCSHDPDIAGDGATVVFSSDATNLVDNDDNARRDVFRKDLASGAIVRLSVDALGAGGDRHSGPSALADDGLTAVFASSARNLLPDDANLQADIFAHDFGAPMPLSRVSLPNDGGESNGPSQRPAVSADGRRVVFDSFATNLVVGQVNNVDQTFFADRDATVPLQALLTDPGHDAARPAISADGTAVCVQTNSALLAQDRTSGFTDIYTWQPADGRWQLDGIASAAVPSRSNGASRRPDLSEDARFVVFQSRSTILDAERIGPGEFEEIYWLDRQSGVSERYPISVDGLPPNGDSLDATVSSDGRYVAFASRASNVVIGDTDSNSDVVRLDRLTGELTWITSLSLTTDSDQPQLSDDGGRIVFRSDSDNLIVGDSNGVSDIFLWQDGAPISRLSVTASGAQANAASRLPRLSPEGDFGVFVSDADNLVGGDSNGVADIFLRDLTAHSTARISIANDGTQADGPSYVADVSALGRYVAFITAAGNISNFNRIGPDVIRWDRFGGIALNASASLPFDEQVVADWVRISDDGRFIAYASEQQIGAALVTNVWRFDVVQQELTLVSSNDGSNRNLRDIDGIGIDASGERLVFAGNDDALTTNDHNGFYDVYLADLRRGPGAIGLATSAITVAEDAGQVVVLIQREDGSAGGVSSSYATFSDSAEAGTDFQARSGVVSFGDAETLARGFAVPIIDDGEYEGDETFTFVLSNPAGGASLGPITELTVTIGDNDPAPERVFGDGFE